MSQQPEPAPGRAARRNEPAGVVHLLHPGDVACGLRGDRFETLLGSCVAILLTDPRRTVGAMCHIVHTVPVEGSRQPSAASGDVAVRTMFALLQAQGINGALCEAYIYGGANMFPDLIKTAHVGEANLRWAFGAMAQVGIPVLGHDVGGTGYRRLSWVVGHGEPDLRVGSD